MKTKLLSSLLAFFCLTGIFHSCNDSDNSDIYETRLTYSELPEEIKLFKNNYLPENEYIEGGLVRLFSSEIPYVYQIKLHNNINAVFNTKGNWMSVASTTELPLTAQRLLSPSTLKLLKEKKLTETITGLENGSYYGKVVYFWLSGKQQSAYLDCPTLDGQGIGETFTSAESFPVISKFMNENSVTSAVLKENSGLVTRILYSEQAYFRVFIGANIIVSFNANEEFMHVKQNDGKTDFVNKFAATVLPTSVVKAIEESEFAQVKIQEITVKESGVYYIDFENGGSLQIASNK